MSIWEAFGMGRHKGFSREAGLLLDEAVELARANSRRGLLICGGEAIALEAADLLAEK